MEYTFDGDLLHVKVKREETVLHCRINNIQKIRKNLRKGLLIDYTIKILSNYEVRKMSKRMYWKNLGI